MVRLPTTANIEPLSTLGEAALEWAAQGFNVFPLCDGKLGDSRGKIPRIPTLHRKTDRPCRGECGKDGHGSYDGTTDPDKIRAWWTRWPNANIGANLGSDRLAFDVDYQHGGVELTAFPKTRKHLTGTGGGNCHLIYRVAVGTLAATLRPKNGALGKGMDLKAGSGAYIVLPPSLHESGKSYLTLTPVRPEHLLSDDDVRAIYSEAGVPLPPPDLSASAAAQERPAVGGQETPERRAVPVRDPGAFVNNLLSQVDDRLAGTATNRNAALQELAWQLYTAVKAGWVGRAEVDRRLVAAMDANGYNESDPGAAARTMAAQWERAPMAHKETKSDERERRVQEEIERLDIRKEAQRRVNSSESSPIPQVLAVAQWLTEPDEQVQYRVDRLWPVGGQVMLIAQAKAGKTTMCGNLVRCLLDGDKFLDEFQIEPVQRNVTILDLEMPQTQAKRWLRDQGITATDRLRYVSLLGQERSLDLFDDDRLAQWVTTLRSVDTEVLILDCLGPWLYSQGIDENDNSAVGGALQRLRELTVAAGVSETLIVHHAGHGGERARGASRLVGGVDATWRITIKDADSQEPDEPRFFGAKGRDVSLSERGLEYDAATRRLSIQMDQLRPSKKIGSGSGRADNLADRVLEALASGAATVEELGPIIYPKQKDPGANVRRLLSKMAQDGLVAKSGGTGGQKATWRKTAGVQADLEFGDF